MFENDYYIIDMPKERLSTVDEIMDVETTFKDNKMKIKVTYDPIKLLSRMYGGRLFRMVESKQKGKI